ncbi:hypothetical protein AVEN_194168-1 [Araneus ventricosus]|uniref:Uncharacterized protein n=1 Tax=Araneus ventricosus TaxID=182803 RepID=A0A4Y2HX12_ARAVE|nr:hypothetical protein AVEN_194168-1 [Araneus ventricosus]
MCETSKDRDGQTHSSPMGVTGRTSLQPGSRTKRFSFLRKKHLKGQHFRINVEVQQDILACPHDLVSDSSCAGFDALLYRWNKLFDKNGDYVEK